MNLIIEEGNTRTKIALFQEEGLLFSSVYDNFVLADLLDLLEKYPIEKGMLSTVKERDEALISLMRQRLRYSLYFDHSLKLPITIETYKLKELGQDRIAAAVGAQFMKPDTPLLVIDAGTAITYEVIDATGSYLGGTISPGLTMRFRALNHYTARLPMVECGESVPSLGYDTESAILSGVVNGVIYEMDGQIDFLRNKEPDVFVFLTGGDAFYFERRLKNSIFAAINLVLVGLNRILEYNVENQ